jgi:hypothetical protein
MSSTVWKLLLAAAILLLPALVGAVKSQGRVTSLHPASSDPTEIIRSIRGEPEIRDFIGPSENAWDFTAPDAIPGFDARSTP